MTAIQFLEKNNNPNAEEKEKKVGCQKSHANICIEKTKHSPCWYIDQRIHPEMICKSVSVVGSDVRGKIERYIRRQFQRQKENSCKVLLQIMAIQIRYITL